MTGSDDPTEPGAKPGDIRTRAEGKAKANRAWLGQNDPENISPMETRTILNELHVHQIELEMQNEELRNTQEKLEKSKERWFELYDLAPVGYVSVDGKGMVFEANLTAMRLLGYDRPSLDQQAFSLFVLKGDQTEYYLFRKQVLETGEPRGCDLRMANKDGVPFWAHLTAAAARDSGGASFCRISLSDISGRKAAEAAAECSFKENRILLAELQHRTKNSFNMISSLINIAAMDNASPEAKAALENLDARVRSVSELYSLLYSTGSIGEVRLDEYCARIAAPLAGLSNIRLVTELESIGATARDAAPIGLILTELMTNAVKYAFPGAKRGTITVLLRRTQAGALLEVSDDGVGLPAGFSPSESSGMGLSLVQTLSSQVKGSFWMGGGPGGTRCVVEIGLAGDNAVPANGNPGTRDE